MTKPGRLPEPKPTYLSVAAVAKRAGVMPSTIRAYLSRGQMPLPDVEGSPSPLWRERTITKWLEERDRCRRRRDQQREQQRVWAGQRLEQRRPSGGRMHIPTVEERPMLLVVEAGHFFGCGREKSYALARRGEFPVPVMRLGTTWRVRTSDVRRALGLD